MIGALDTLSKEPLANAGPNSRDAKLKAIRIVDQELNQNMVMLNDPEFPKILSWAIGNLLRVLSDEDMNVWSLAKEVLNKHIKSKLKWFSERIVFELYRGMKGFSGRSQRIAIELFGAVCNNIKPNRCQKFIQSLLPVWKKILTDHDEQGEGDLLLLETLGNSFEPIAAQLVPYFTEQETRDIVSQFAVKQGAVRRSSSNAVVSIIRHFPGSLTIMRYAADLLIQAANIGKFLLGLLEEKRANFQKFDQNEITQMLLETGVSTDLDAISAAIQGRLHCFLQLFKLSIDLQNENKFTDDPMLADLLYCTNLCIEFAKHPDNNVIVAALELLQVIFQSYTGYLVELWGPEKTKNTIQALLTDFNTMMQDEAVRITGKSSIVTCCTRIAASCVSSYMFSKDADSLLVSLFNLLEHSDQTLRGQAAYFVSEVICSYALLESPPPLPNDITITQLVEKLLTLIHTDGSSITAKMACSGVVNCWRPLANSRYALWALYIIQSLLCVRPDGFRLVKTEVVTFFSKIDYGLVHFLSRCGHNETATKENIIPFVPCNLLIFGHQNLQVECVDKIRSYLTDADVHVRLCAAESLAQLPTRLHYVSYWHKDAQWSSSYAPTALHSFPTSIKSMQCLAPFAHLTETPEDSPKSSSKTVIGIHNHVDFERFYLGRFTSPAHAKCHWYINEFVDGLLKTDDVILLKGIYKMFSAMAEKHTTFPLPMSFVIPVILDQIETLSIGTDIDTQYDILVLLTHVVGQLSKELARYAHRIFLHFVRLAYLVTAVVKKSPKATYVELKPGIPEGTLQTIQGHPQYLKLWDRLSDTYRIGRSTFGDENMFEAVQRATFQGLSQCVTKIGRQFMMPFIAELLTYIAANFDDQPLAVVESLRVLFVATFNLAGHPASLPTDPIPLSSSSTVHLQPQPPKPEANEVKHESTAKPSQLYQDLLAPAKTHPIFMKEKATRARGWSEGGWSEVISDVTSRQTPQLMNAVLKRGNSRQLLTSFEPIVATCMVKYTNTQDSYLQQAILSLLTTLISYEVEFSALDKDRNFFRHIVAQVQTPSPAMMAQLNFLAVLHLERRYLHTILKIKSFASYTVNCFQTWTGLQKDFSISTLQVIYTLFSPNVLMPSDAEVELRAEMRKAAIVSLQSKLPHATAVHLMHHLLDVLGIPSITKPQDPRAPHPPHPPPTPEPPGGAHPGGRKRTYTSSKAPFLRLIANGVMALVTSPWRLSKVALEDMLGVFHILDRIPKSAFNLNDLLGFLHTLLYEKEEPVQHASGTTPGHLQDYVAKKMKSYWFPAVLLVLRTLHKFKEKEILAALGLVYPTGNPDNLSPPDLLAFWLSEMLSVAAKQPRGERRNTQMTSVLVDSINYLVCDIMAGSVSAPMEQRLRDSDSITSLVCSYQSAVGYPVIRLLHRLNATHIIRQVLQINFFTWHSSLLKSTAFITAVQMHTALHDDGLMEIFKELCSSDTEEQEQAFLWLLINHIHEAPIQAFCVSLAQIPHVADYLTKFVRNQMQTPHHIPVVHAFLTILVSMPRSEPILQLVIDQFCLHPVVSVQIAAENYIYNIFKSKDDTALPLKSFIQKSLVANARSLRASFLKRLMKVSVNVAPQFFELDVPDEIFRGMATHESAKPTPRAAEEQPERPKQSIPETPPKRHTSHGESSKKHKRSHKKKHRTTTTDTQKEAQEVPQEVQEVPEVQGLPQEAQGAPQEAQGVLQEAQGVPQEAQGVPQEVPQEAQGVPQKAQEVPQEAQGTPQEPPKPQLESQEGPGEQLTQEPVVEPPVLSSSPKKEATPRKPTKPPPEFVPIESPRGPKPSKNQPVEVLNKPTGKGIQTVEIDLSAKETQTPHKELVTPKSKEELQFINKYLLSHSSPRSALAQSLLALKTNRNWDAIFSLLDENPFFQFYHFDFILSSKEPNEAVSNYFAKKINQAILAAPSQNRNYKCLKIVPIITHLISDHQSSLWEQTQILPPLALHHFAIEMLEHLSLQILFKSGVFRPRYLIDCLRLLIVLLQNIPPTIRTQIFHSPRNDSIYSKWALNANLQEDEPNKGENKEASKELIEQTYQEAKEEVNGEPKGKEEEHKEEHKERKEGERKESIKEPQGNTARPQTEFEWRVRTVYRLFVSLFKQQTSSSSSTNFAYLMSEATQLDSSSSVEQLLEFCWSILHTCGRGSFGMNQRKTRADKTAFQYMHDDFVVLFHEISNEVPNPEKLRQLTESRFEENGNIRRDPIPIKKDHYSTSPILSFSLYPFQDEIINFDNNENPLEILMTFIQLIRGSDRAMAGVTFLRLWDQFFAVANVSSGEQELFATTPVLKVVALRALVILFLKWGTQVTSPSIESPTTFEQLQEKLDQLFRLLAVYVTQYKKGDHSDLILLHCESLRSFVLLAPLMQSEWVAWVADMFYALGQSLPEFGEDPFARQYITLGLAKFDAEMCHEARSLGKDMTELTMEQKRLSVEPKNSRIGPPARIVPKSNSVERMALLNYLIQGGLTIESEVIEQVFALQSIPVLVEIHHPNSKILAKSTTILNWLNEKKELPRDRSMRSERWKQKIRGISDGLSNVHSFKPEDANLLGWAERIAQNPQLFGLQDSRDINESDHEDEIETPEKIVAKKTEEATDLMLNMAKMKELFQRIRTRKTKEQQRIDVSELSQVLIDSFQGEAIISFIIGELSKPMENGHFITEALFQIIEIDTKAGTQPALQDLIVNWIMMCLDNFVQIVAIPGGEKHSLFSLTCLLLIACRNSMRTIFLYDLFYGTLPEPSIKPIFLFAGTEFYRRLKDTEKLEFVTALGKMKKEPYSALKNILE